MRVFTNFRETSNQKIEFTRPENDEEELRLGLELLGELDESKGRFWEIVKSYSRTLDTDSDTFKSTSNKIPFSSGEFSTKC